MLGPAIPIASLVRHRSTIASPDVCAEFQAHDESTAGACQLCTVMPVRSQPSGWLGCTYSILFGYLVKGDNCLVGDILLLLTYTVI